MIFDLDGTLSNYRTSALAAYSRVFIKAQETLGPLPVKRLVGHLLSADPQNWAEYAHGRIDLGELWRRRWGGAIAAEGLHAGDALLERLSGYYAEILPGCTRIYADARLCLERLLPRFRLALLTNSPGETARPKLRHHGLEPFFEFIGVGKELGALKPSPEAFEAVLRATGVSASEALMVGDNFEEDVRGAGRAGLLGVWVRRQDSTFDDGDLAEPFAIAESLTEVAVFLDRWWETYGRPRERTLR